MSTLVSYPAPPDGYRYMLDGKGNQTTVLTKIETTATASTPSSYVAFSEVSGNVATASGNLLSAQESLAAAATATTDPTVKSAITSASDLVTNAWGKLQSLNPLSSSTESKSVMESAKGMLSSAMTKLDSVGEYVSGQVSGLMTSAKDAIGKASAALGAGITKITDAAKKFVGDAFSNTKASIPTESTGPTFKDTMDAIKSGAVYKDISASLSKVSDVASSLPTEMAAGLASAQAAIAAKMSALQSKIGTEMALAKANQDLLTKETIAATGKPPTQDQLDAAAGNIAIFKDGPKYLADQAKSIATTVASYASAFGTKVGNALGVVKSGAETGAATTVGAAVTNFVNTIPPQTIPDPENPGQTIANPAYVAFADANPDKMAAVNNLTTSVQNASATLTAGFTSLTSAADSAKAGIVTNLKASALAGQIATPATGMMADIKNQTIDMSKMDAMNMAKTNALAAKAAVTSNPSPGGNETNAKEDPATKSTEVKTLARANEADRVYRVEALNYNRDYVQIHKDLAKEYKTKVEESPEYKTNLVNKTAADKVRANKPDESTWTDEEKAIIEKHKESKAIAMSSDVYVQYKKYYDIYVKEIDNYNNYIFKVWQEESSRSNIPPEIRSRLSLQATYEKALKENSA